jgi:hypothetical protein
MSNTIIQLRKSSVPNEIPSDLEFGEIAINYADGKFFYKNSTNQIVSFSGTATGNVYSFATINANGSFITATATNSILAISNGDNIEIAGDIVNDIITISANLKSVFDVANAAFNTANTGGAGSSNSFTTIAVPGQSNIVASINDTLNFVAGNNINITTDSVTKSIVINSLGLGYTDYGSITEPLTSSNDYGSL